ncbi:hypothetical protein [Massilia sp. Leaf139]|uniref:hypothetical protein n=1 Tax=Massilia sp. Leaf139 TaxID=1736272 RepID=UPI0006F7B601|nr:hypothetical protein [Massilia sp. Leaf139]KQQ86434.1 hypothetical protein ASF77_20900 [Massilia sp. Leaf139]
MSVLPACTAVLPGYLCGQMDILLYLVPSMAVAFLFWMLSGAHPAFFLLTAPGTLCHELAHFGVGLLTNAEPTNISLFPRRKGKVWELGSVTFSNLRWYNAAPAALAPLLILLLPIAVAAWRTGPGWHFAPIDLVLAVLLAPQFLSFWPSPVDWRLASRSWPWAVLLISGGVIYLWNDLLLGLVRG